MWLLCSAADVDAAADSAGSLAGRLAATMSLCLGGQDERERVTSKTALPL